MSTKSGKLKEKAERNFIFTPTMSTLVTSCVEKRAYIFAMGVGTGIEIEMYDIELDEWIIMPSF